MSKRLEIWGRNLKRWKRQRPRRSLRMLFPDHGPADLGNIASQIAQRHRNSTQQEQSTAIARRQPRGTAFFPPNFISPPRKVKGKTKGQEHFEPEIEFSKTQGLSRPRYSKNGRKWGNRDQGPMGEGERKSTGEEEPQVWGTEASLAWVLVEDTSRLNCL